MRVLLISANTEQINMPVLPLGLAYVAAAIDGQGHTVKMLNLMTQTDTQKALYGTIADFNPEIIGISVRNIDGVFSASVRSKKYFNRSSSFRYRLRNGHRARGLKLPYLM